MCFTIDLCRKIPFSYGTVVFHFFAKILRRLDRAYKVIALKSLYIKIYIKIVLIDSKVVGFCWIHRKVEVADTNICWHNDACFWFLPSNFGKMLDLGLKIRPWKFSNY